MAEALVSVALEQLALILRQQIETEVRLVVGVDEEVRKLTRNFQAILAVLDDAENKQVRDNAVKDWLDKLRDTSYDIDDVLDEWSTAIGKLQSKQAEHVSRPMRHVCSLIPFNCFCFRQSVLRHDIALKIRDLNRTLDVIAMEKDRFRFRLTSGIREPKRQMTASVIDVSEVYGREPDKNMIVKLLLSEDSHGPTLPIISIVGMGGIGKTTLARLVFNDDMVSNHFEKRIWVCVSDFFDEIRIAKAILESLIDVAPNLVELETVLRHIRQSIEGKKFLLILDDVWTEDPKNWEQLNHSLRFGSRESRILVTTRKERVANTMESIKLISLGTLMENECWSLFRQVAFSERTDAECKTLEDVGRKIVSKCKGLPLAVKTLGSLLRFKRKFEDWQSILDSELWKLSGIESGVFPPLLMSYNDLPSIMKKCFSFCAIFPKDYVIEKDILVKLWMAQGCLKVRGMEDMELVGEEYFENLSMLSLFHDFERSEYDGSIIKFKMHDIVHDFAQFVAKNERFNMKVEGPGEPQLVFPNKRVRHVMVMAKSIPISFYNEKKLRGLLIKWTSNIMIEIDMSKLFDQLACLRILSLSGLPISELPIGIEKLIYLRYLNLSYNEVIKELLERLYELYNLQSLDLTGCCNLQTLPLGMSKLINLRHLINSQNSKLTYFPKGIERLTCLQTLIKITVSGAYAQESKACSLECLKDLNQLRGFLTISGLGNLVDVSQAKKAELKNKKNLRHIIIKFNGWMHVNDEVVLEGLQPPPNLEKLEVEFYRGKTVYFNWMMSLTKLRELELYFWNECERLPPLGKLSSLESLTVWYLRNVKRIGNEILGIESEYSSSFSSVIAFPKLKSLTFWGFQNLEEWDYDITKWVEEDIKIMPCLHFIKLYSCPKLKALPEQLLHITTLE